MHVSMSGSGKDACVHIDHGLGHGGYSTDAENAGSGDDDMENEEG